MQPLWLDYQAPAADLRKYVSSIYLFSANLRRVADVARAETAQLRFMLAGHGCYVLPDGTEARAPSVTLTGPTMSAVRLDFAGPVRLVGVGLLPAGWAELVGDDADTCADRVLHASECLGPLVNAMHDALAGARTDGETVAIVNAGLRALIARRRCEDHWFTRIAEGWLTGTAAPRVDGLVAACDLSARQVERLCARFYGAPPSLIARKYRTLRAATRLSAGATHWRDAATDFYDQSHMIREFRRFCGTTPTALITSPSPLMKLTMQLRREQVELPRLLAIS